MATMQIKRQILREIRNETWHIEILLFIKQLFQIDICYYYAIIFRSYLQRLKDYNSSKCTNRCNQRQTPEHLLLNCIHYFDEILNMKQNIDTTINLNMLFNTKIGNDILIKFIVNNKIATRKWTLLTQMHRICHQTENLACFHVESGVFFRICAV